MKTCPSCGRKIDGEKYCPACNYYMGNIPDTPRPSYFAVDNKPRVTCPYCHSANCTKISGVHRWLSTGLFGIASSDIGKQWKCNNCGSKF